MESFDILVDLVRTGFHGVALAFVYLGYRAIRDVTTQPSDDDPTNDEEETRRLEMKLSAIHRFVLLSLVFFLLGIGSEMLRGFVFKAYKQDIMVSLQPHHIHLEQLKLPVPELRHNLIPFDIDEGGAIIRVSDRDKLEFLYDSLIARIYWMNTENNLIQDEQQFCIALTDTTGARGF
ncbi:MAG: hypothetical protein R3362_04440 [Rhodothermales bacterium]|nr:hypothetical protein [Rhodothermales bacterium]